MKVVIIEDEKPAARRLSRMLQKQSLTVHTMLHSVASAKDWFLTNEHPDLIFLDIQLSDGIAFEIFENITVKSAIIFTTAYDQYALKAFKLNSIDYLLKPIEEEALIGALQKHKAFAPNKELAAVSYTDLKQLLHNQPEYKTRFTIKVGQQLKIIPITNIECFYSEHKATYIHTLDGRQYVLEQSLEQLEEQLNSTSFFRINRQCVINMSAIKTITQYTNSRLKISLNTFNNALLIVSRERVKAFKSWVN